MWLMSDNFIGPPGIRSYQEYAPKNNMSKVNREFM